MNRHFFYLAACGILLSLGWRAPARQHDGFDSGADRRAVAASDGHDHGEVGLHGGHLLHLEPTGAHAEWTHDDESHQIDVYLDELDAAKIETVKFVVKIGDKAEEFPLEKGEQSWSITSEALMTHLEMGDAVTVSLVVVNDLGEQSTKIEQHEHHHH